VNDQQPRANSDVLIAVIDDDVSMRVATDSFLLSYGYSVATFEAAGDFLKSAQLNNTACVITDVRMPTMGGIELQARLRSHGSRIPFIFVTAFPEESVRAQALKDGATGFLRKPFDGPTLIKYVELAVAGTRSTNSN
jgi:FixJ family two-component response regulator